MKKIILLIILVFGFSLNSCQDYTLIKEEFREFEVIHIDPPKRFHVTLKDLSTGNTYIEYISKRCSNYRVNKIGDKHKLVVRIYEGKNDKVRYTRIVSDTYSIFCP